MHLARFALGAGAVLVSWGLVGCFHLGPKVETSIEFDGENRTITTNHVACIRQPDGGLVIVVTESQARTFRAQLTTQGHLVVQKAGLRYDNLTGYVEAPGEVTATKVDDAYTFSGRMPPNPGESAWHTFTVRTSCPGYRDGLPSGPPPMGAS
jgi:lipoprotein antigen